MTTKRKDLDDFLLSKTKTLSTRLDRYYLAYGSNLSFAGMKRRCPGAKPLATALLKDWKLVFRSVADLVKAPGAKAMCGLWKISEKHEAELDIYEGVGRGVYRKQWFNFPTKKRVLVYLMNDDGIYPPAKFYADIIRAGYKDFGLDQKFLDAAISASYISRAHSAKTFTRRRRQRHDRTQIALAPRPETALKTQTETVR